MKVMKENIKDVEDRKHTSNIRILGFSSGQEVKTTGREEIT